MWHTTGTQLGAIDVFALSTYYEGEGFVPYVERPAMALETEISTYREHLKTWSNHQGQFVLIKGDQVVGFFSSYDDALRRGYEKFKLEAFLVKAVSVLEQRHLVTRFFDPSVSSPAK